MLVLPIKGISKSVQQHNIDLAVMCDWIEGSVLFSDSELSKMEVLDVLMEEQIYEKNDMCMEMISNAWSEIKKRQLWISGGTPYSFEGNRIIRKNNWEDVPAYSFCLLLSLAALYRDWAKRFGSDYTKQGRLFEELTNESLAQQFKDWKFHLTGWSKVRAAQLKTIINEIAGLLGETVGNLSNWTTKDQKDAELDMLCYRPFEDRRTGVPVYLMQCASGCNWEQKLHTPRLELWSHYIDFTSKPKKAFATPFALTDEVFNQKCVLVDGMLIDRYRILAACGTKNKWMSDKLRKNLISWAQPRVRALLRQKI